MVTDSMATGFLMDPELFETVRRYTAAVLSTHRRRFYPDKDYGSRLYDLTRYQDESAAAAALAAAQQALADMHGVYALKAVPQNGYVSVTLTVNGMEGVVNIPYHENDE